MKENNVVHFEIYANDPSALSRFYSSLFDWKIEQMPHMDYRWVQTVETDASRKPSEPGGINGGMIQRPEGYDGNAWISYVLVKSIEATTDRAQTLGAKLMKGKSAVPGMGWFAMFVDPQGNHFAIWQPDSNAK